MTLMPGHSATPETEDPLERLISENSESPQERLRRERGERRLKKRLSRAPFYAKRAAAHPNPDEYWSKLYASCCKA